MQENRLLTTKEVADELRRSERWVINEIKAGHIQAISLGKGYRIYRAELERYLRERQTKRDE